MPKLGVVWRRAAPTLHIKDPHKDEKLAEIKAALKRCNINHPVFYEDEDEDEDEVDIHLNPKIGADWMHKGHEKRVTTPGQKSKRYLAGALHTGTGKSVMSPVQAKILCYFFQC
ncbi:hypothetical protein NBRC116591_29710 [Sessilibacter corallicola]|uniref:Helicase/UvrB N-terminal domain-containing protein n=1 Tax=Sessilibacter corallicola TaxID=2904075 RepID=A0ABQ0ABY2_9GAMM